MKTIAWVFFIFAEYIIQSKLENHIYLRQFFRCIGQMRRVTDGQTERPKPVCLLKFFKFGGMEGTYLKFSGIGQHEYAGFKTLADIENKLFLNSYNSLINVLS